MSRTEAALRLHDRSGSSAIRPFISSRSTGRSFEQHSRSKKHSPLILCRRGDASAILYQVVYSTCCVLCNSLTSQEDQTINRGLWGEVAEGYRRRRLDTISIETPRLLARFLPHNLYSSVKTVCSNRSSGGRLDYFKQPPRRSVPARDPCCIQQREEPPPTAVR